MKNFKISPITFQTCVILFKNLRRNLQ